jgi:rfaE bifunctional protein nucleotidyltransferase chain/domain
MNTSAKIVSRAKAAEIGAEARDRGRRVVLANGCFDLLHVGHARYLTGARACGDLLIVGVNGDASVRRLKGPGRPLLDEQARAALVAALASVDYVVLFEDDNVRGLIAEIRPDVHAKGTDYTAESVPERDAVLAIGGQVAIVGDPKGHNTRDLIRHILHQHHEAG